MQKINFSIPPNFENVYFTKEGSEVRFTLNRSIGGRFRKSIFALKLLYAEIDEIAHVEVQYDKSTSQFVYCLEKDTHQLEFLILALSLAISGVVAYHTIDRGTQTYESMKTYGIEEELQYFPWTQKKRKRTK